MKLCFLGIHKYRKESRTILTTDGGSLKTKDIPIIRCAHCYKPKNYEQAVFQAILESTRHQ